MRYPRYICGLTALVSCLLWAGMAAAGPKGADIHAEMVETIGVYDDQALTQYIEGLVRDIVSVSEKAGEKFTVTLLDSPDVNAFATRDNYVYVNRGLLAYVNNEAQLVSVLAHEVAHITQEHVDTLEGQAGGATFLAWLAGALSGSPEVYEAGMAYANSLLKGHGRDNELEADEAGARYMAKLGYDPQETLAMLTTLKDMEMLQKERAAAKGAPARTYHGIFSTHPRNDMRLRSAVSRGARNETAGSRDSGADRFRRATEGLVWGENFVEKELEANRYRDLSLRVRLDFPEGWTFVEDAQNRSVRGAPADAAASLTMQPQPRTLQTPEEYLYNHLNIGQLRDGREIQPARLKGFTGILPGAAGQPDQRIAVVYYKMNAYLFTGEVADASKFTEYDTAFLAAVDSFRPVSSREIAGQKPTKLHYVKATSATTFAALAQELKLSEYEAEELRLINGYYPKGEPKPGEWIKIFVQ